MNICNCVCKMFYSQVLTGSEVESDYQEPQTIDTRVVMGEETLLKTTEIKKGNPFTAPSDQAVPLPDIQSFSDPQAQAKETQLETRKEENQSPKQEAQQKDRADPSATLPMPFHNPMLPPSTSPGSLTTDDSLMEKKEECQSLSQDEVPSHSFSEPSCPVALSFSEPVCAVDPLRVGVPSCLDPDLYYTAPSTPIKMASRSSHLKHHSYPGSPVSPLSPGSPSDSEDLCSPLTSPSGSYITAEGGSWTSSYTSSTSPSTSPNPLLTEETQEAPACFVGSLSEIGDEVGEEKGRIVPEREEERAGDFCLYHEGDFALNSPTGITDTVIVEEEEILKGDEVSVSRESCRPCWVTEDTSPLRSSSSSDSQEDGGGYESSLCPLDEDSIERAESSRPIQSGLRLQLEACVSEEHYGQMDVHQEPPSTALTPDTENMTMASSSLSPDSPVLSLDAFFPGAFDRLGPSSFILSQAACADDIPEEERMIPASLISFPLHTSLIFKADSMEITLFPTEEENEIEVNDRNEEKDVDAYAAGEEEADVEDDDEDEEDDDYDYDDDFDGNANGAVSCDEYEKTNKDDGSDDRKESGEEAKVEVKVVEEDEEEEEEEEEDEDDDDECHSRAVEDPTDEDSSASFLHSLSETSLNEGLDESFCFQDDTEESSDSASYNGEEDERLYSTERHAQSLEPTSADGPDPGQIQSEPERATVSDTVQNEPLPSQQSMDELADRCKTTCLSEATAHPKGNNVDPSPVDACKIPETQSDPELESTSETGQAKHFPLQASTDKPLDHQKLSCPAEANSSLSDSDDPNKSANESEMTYLDFFSNPLEGPKPSPFFNPSSTPDTSHVSPSFATESHMSHIPPSATSVQETTDQNISVFPEEDHQGKDVDFKLPSNSGTVEKEPERDSLKLHSDNSVTEPINGPERDSFKLLIKPRHYHSESQRTVGASRRVLSKSFCSKYDVPVGAEAMCRTSIHSESDIDLDQKNGNASAESVSVECRISDSGPSLNNVIATNDLNKGVPLLSCPKDPSPNPSNIPVSTSPEVISELADNLALTPEHCPGDSSQENLRENTLSTDEGVLGAVGSPHSPFAISPKRENSEMDTSREMGSVAGAWCDTRVGMGFSLGLGAEAEFGVWGAGESLSLSLGKRYELEAESLLMCDAEGQSKQTAMVSNMNSEECRNYDNVLGSMLDEDDNNSLHGEKRQTDTEELVGEGVSESNLARCKSTEEISVEGGGEDGNASFLEDDISNLNPHNDGDNTETQIQNTWKNCNNNSESAFGSAHGSLNALSEEVRHQSVSVSIRDSVSNIPLEEMPPQVSDMIPDGDRKSTDSLINQTPETTQTPFPEKGGSSISVPLTETHSDAAATNKHFDLKNETNLRSHTGPECQTITPESDTSFSLVQGSFGSFTPKCKSDDSKPSKACQEKVNTGSLSETEIMESQTESQRKCDGSPLMDKVVDEPKTKDAFREQQHVVYNSGEDNEEDKVEEKAKERGAKKDKKKKQERKSRSAQNDSEHFPCDSPKEGHCTDTSFDAKKGRRGRQKQRAPLTDSQGASSPESVVDPEKPAVLLNNTPGVRSKGNAETSKSKTGHNASNKFSSLDCQQKTPGTDKVESGSQLQVENNPSPDVSTTHTTDNLNIVVAMNQDVQQEVLDNRPLPDNQRGLTVDINDNNIDITHNTIPYSLNPLCFSASPVSSSSSSCSLPCASTDPEHDLSTPVQESQPDLSAQQRQEPSLFTCHTTPVRLSTSPTTQNTPNSQFLPTTNLQEITDVLSTSTVSATTVSSPLFSTAMPLSLFQSAQESSLPELGNLDAVCIPDSSSHPQSQSYSQSHANARVQSHKQVSQGHTWSTQDRCKGE